MKSLVLMGEGKMALVAVMIVVMEMLRGEGCY